MRDFFSPVLEAFEAVLGFLHNIFAPIFGVHSWGWAIIALTLVVRVLLLPLAIKQTRSMRAMQAIQPEMKALQKKYKVDRELMRKDPEQYRAKRAKLNEEMMALYKREGANPAASCLPLLAQAPIFIALFWTLNLSDDFEAAPFYFFTDFVSSESAATGLAAQVSQAGWPGWMLILLMSGTMFWTQKQMLARNRLQQGGENPMMQQQKILMYGMPIFLAVISFQFPLGILLYWVTTNVWQVAQQAIILREVTSEQPKPSASEDDGDGSTTRRSPGASSGTKPVAKDPGSTGSGKDPSGKGGSGKGSSGKGQTGKGQTGKGQTEKGSKGDGSSSGRKQGQGRANEPKQQGSGSSGTDKKGKGSRNDPQGKAPKGEAQGSSSNGQRPRGSRPSNGAGKQRPVKDDHIPRRRRR